MAFSCKKWFRRLRLGGGRRSLNVDEAISLFVKKVTGKAPTSVELYEQALTHKSFRPTAGGTYVNNERLEFLGDGLLNAIVGYLLFDMYPDETEGVLTSRRATLVNRSNMNATAKRLGVNDLLRYDTTSLDVSTTDTPGNALEALIGAIYLDQGYRQAERFVMKHIIISRENLKRVSVREEDYKTEFIILMQKEKIPFEFVHLDSRPHPKYNIIHRCTLLAGSKMHPIATGSGTSKKVAHQNAAKDALRLFQKRPDILSDLSQ